MTALLYTNQILVEVSVDALQLEYQTCIALLKRHCELLTMRLLHTHATNKIIQAKSA